MNFRLTLHVLGGLLLFLGATLLTPIPFSLYYRDGQIVTFLVSAAVTALSGYFLFRFFRSREEVTLREGFAIVTFTWLSFAVFGSLPYLISAHLPSALAWPRIAVEAESPPFDPQGKPRPAPGLRNPIDAFFESMSGFATAGASVITDVEATPRSVLFWRALSQWIGGMGIIVLTVAILPLLGVGGMQLYEAEAPGPTTDRLTPRIQDTARLLWGVYALLTVVGVLMLWVGDMDFYDAVCHTFAALATGGFSTRNASLGAFGSYSQVVIIFLMVVGGANFSLHYYAMRGQVGKYWRSEEFRFYLGLLGLVTLIVFLFNWREYDNPLLNVRDSAFTVTSILTTTGFATADYEEWPFLSQGLLVALMFLGGCAGSTAGGLKLARVVLLLKHAGLQLTRLLHPRQVRVLKLDRSPVSQDIMQDILGYTVLFVGVYAIGSLLVAAAGVDLLTAGTAVVACMSTVGPGLGEVGPLDNYASLPYFAKIVISLVMLLGRLEFSTMLVMFFLTYWKK